MLRAQLVQEDQGKFSADPVEWTREKLNDTATTNAAINDFKQNLGALVNDTVSGIAKTVGNAAGSVVKGAASGLEISPTILLVGAAATVLLVFKR
jgi:hypothetical protein